MDLKIPEELKIWGEIEEVIIDSDDSTDDSSDECSGEDERGRMVRRDSMLGEK